MLLGFQILLLQSERRRSKLVDSYEFQRFLGEYRTLTGWVYSTNALVSSDELAKDMGGAELLLERHQEQRTEIDAKKAAFTAFDSFGGQLLAKQHFASSEIEEKMRALKQERASLEKLVEFSQLYLLCVLLVILHNSLSR